jgi:hypothetical protein
MHKLPLHFSPLLDEEVAADQRLRGRVNLDEEVHLARHYFAQLANQGSRPRHLDLAEELHTRLEQMNFLLKSVAILLTEFSERRFGDKVREDPRDQLWFMMFLYAEAFYYIAHRVQHVLAKGGLPHIKGFTASRKITIIRNHLIEHAYGQSKEFGGSHGAVSGNDGPIVLLRGPTTPPEHLRPQDRGLFPNARELKNRLNPVLARALEEVGGEIIREKR